MTQMLQRARLGRTLIERGWRSPTFMTWASYLTKSLTFFAVLPLLLSRLEAPDIALWYLFSSIVSLQLLADSGFSPTFVRVISFAVGGAGPDRLRDLRSVQAAAVREPNWDTVQKICATMRVVYNRLTFGAMLLMASIGTAAVARPISKSTDPGAAWTAWGVILLCSAFILRGNTFSAYLQGLNKIALLRRWEALTNLAAVLSSVVVLLLGGGLLALVVVNQSWALGNIVRNWLLCRTVEDGRFRRFRERTICPQVMDAVWPSAWRSGLGTLMGQAPLQFTGLFFAQVGSSDGVATYMMSLNLLTAIRNFSMAPFYSKIPLLARLRAEGNLTEQLNRAKRGMTAAYWSYVVPFVIVGLAGDPLLHLIGSNARFADPLLWSLLGLGMFIERFGAMHLHWYSTTNHIIWHVANGVTGAIFVVLSTGLFGAYGVYAFPVAYIVSYLIFYGPYTARHSYHVMNLRWWRFERSVSLAPMFVLLLFTAVRVGYYLSTAR